MIIFQVYIFSHCKCMSCYEVFQNVLHYGQVCQGKTFRLPRIYNRIKIVQLPYLRNKKEYKKKHTFDNMAGDNALSSNHFRSINQGNVFYFLRDSQFFIIKHKFIFTQAPTRNTSNNKTQTINLHFDILVFPKIVLQV